MKKEDFETITSIDIKMSKDPIFIVGDKKYDRMEDIPKGQDFEIAFVLAVEEQDKNKTVKQIFDEAVAENDPNHRP